MNGVTVVGIMIATVLVTVLIVHSRRDRAIELYERYRFFQKFAAAIIGILIAWTLINSGQPVLMLLAVLGLASATVYWYVERPDEEVV